MSTFIHYIIRTKINCYNVHLILFDIKPNQKIFSNTFKTFDIRICLGIHLFEFIELITQLTFMFLRDIIFSPYEEMSSEYCYGKHLCGKEYVFYFNNKIRIMKSKKSVHVLININKHHLFKLNVE